VKEASKKPESAEPSNPKDVSKSAATPAPTPPGFEAIFAIAALLAVAYLVGRKK
jgi:PGF-CTERM protein